MVRLRSLCLENIRAGSTCCDKWMAGLAMNVDATTTAAAADDNSDDDEQQLFPQSNTSIQSTSAHIIKVQRTYNNLSFIGRLFCKLSRRARTHTISIYIRAHLVFPATQASCRSRRTTQKSTRMENMDKFMWEWPRNRVRSSMDARTPSANKSFGSMSCVFRL